MKLTPLEKQSAVWIKLKAHLEQRLNECRLKNDGDLTETETARLRGRIAAYRELLSLDEQAIDSLAEAV